MIYVQYPRQRSKKVYSFSSKLIQINYESDVGNTYNCFFGVLQVIERLDHIYGQSSKRTENDALDWGKKFVLCVKIMTFDVGIYSK